ncbi:LytR C-terminal domain-containing protein [Streptomyces sp. NPDC048172]|uniref:LytR C-terminal domain-containing protein n=1 Tax=Streptomyces sp. NPDC048172 TaxID=3365505 RepID=UPI00371D6A1E
MSMLTPPGMGGKYRIKGDRYPRMRRSRGRGKVIASSVAAVVALAVIGWGTLQLIDIFSGGDKAASASDGSARTTDCASASASASRAAKQAEPLPSPGSVKVNVLNATSRAGLAKTTADALKKRGFKIGKVGNAPKALDKKVKKTGVLIGAPGTDTAAGLKVLGTQLDGADIRHDKARKGGDVDLVIGEKFKKLVKEGAATKTLAKLSKPSPSPSATRC